ncbi:MAG: alpha/beta fold hydrolase [Mycobacteriales bacterium]
METVISCDGTAIAYDTRGDGPPAVLVDGPLSHRGCGSAARLAELLAERLTVITYDRRGRGASGDVTPYAVEREVEDLAALLDAAGGTACLYGVSAGAALALAAADGNPAVTRLALYEPPFVVDDWRPPLPARYLARLTELLAAGHRADAVELYLTRAVGLPVEFVTPMRRTPLWPAMEAMAHTLAYDAMVLGDTQSGRPLPAARWAAVTAPALVIEGGRSEVFLRHAARALAAVLPCARHHVLPDQDHQPVPEALAPVLLEFFTTP